jgi:hypothetical protein
MLYQNNATNGATTANTFHILVTVPNTSDALTLNHSSNLAQVEHFMMLHRSLASGKNRNVIQSPPKPLPLTL